MQDNTQFIRYLIALAILVFLCMFGASRLYSAEVQKLFSSVTTDLQGDGVLLMAPADGCYVHVQLFYTHSYDDNGHAKARLRLRSSYNPIYLNRPAVRVNGEYMGQSAGVAPYDVQPDGSNQYEYNVTQLLAGQTLNVELVVLRQNILTVAASKTLTVATYLASDVIFTGVQASGLSSVSSGYRGNGAGKKRLMQYYNIDKQEWVTFNTLESCTGTSSDNLTLKAWQIQATDPDWSPDYTQWRSRYVNTDGTVFTDDNLNFTGTTYNYDANSVRRADYVSVAVTGQNNLTDQQAVLDATNQVSYNGGKSTATQTVVATTGTSTDSVQALNVQTGIQRNLLSQSVLATAQAARAADSLDAIKESLDSGGGEGGPSGDVSDAQTHDLLDTSGVDVSDGVDAENTAAADRSGVISEMDTGVGKVPDVSSTVLPAPPTVSVTVGSWDRKFHVEGTIVGDVVIDFAFLDPVAAPLRDCVKWALQILLWWWMVRTIREMFV